MDHIDRGIIRELQEGLPLVTRPFAAIADKLRISEEEVISRIRSLMDSGVIRRFGAAVRHRKLGFLANAMVVWKVPAEKSEEMGCLMSSFPEVTHCYIRATTPAWPYNMYTVVHGKTERECREAALKLSKAAGITDYRVLFSTAELKKSSMKYFLDE